MGVPHFRENPIENGKWMENQPLDVWVRGYPIPIQPKRDGLWGTILWTWMKDHYLWKPLWKIWKSVGMISNPIYGKIELMFPANPLGGSSNWDSKWEAGISHGMIWDMLRIWKIIPWIVCGCSTLVGLQAVGSSSQQDETTAVFDSGQK